MKLRHIRYFFFVLLIMQFGMVFAQSNDMSDKEKGEWLEKRHCDIIDDHFKEKTSNLTDKMKKLEADHEVLLLVNGYIEEEVFHMCTFLKNVFAEGLALYKSQSVKRTIGIKINYTYEGTAEKPTSYTATGEVWVEDGLSTIFDKETLDMLNNGVLNYPL